MSSHHDRSPNPAASTWSPFLILVPYSLFPTQEPEGSDKIRVRARLMFLLCSYFSREFRLTHIGSQMCAIDPPPLPTSFPTIPPPSLCPHRPACWALNPTHLLPIQSWHLLFPLPRMLSYLTLFLLPHLTFSALASF